MLQLMMAYQRPSPDCCSLFSWDLQLCMDLWHFVLWHIIKCIKNMDLKHGGQYPGNVCFLQKM